MLFSYIKGKRPIRMCLSYIHQIYYNHSKSKSIRVFQISQKNFKEVFIVTVQETKKTVPTHSVDTDDWY